MKAKHIKTINNHYEMAWALAFHYDLLESSEKYMTTNKKEATDGQKQT